MSIGIEKVPVGIFLTLKLAQSHVGYGVVAEKQSGLWNKC